jgi:predicted RNA polymerase sigma factor
MQEPRDWSQIAALYGELVRLTGSAVVELNRAIAMAEKDGGEAGLALVDRLDLDDYQYFQGQLEAARECARLQVEVEVTVKHADGRLELDAAATVDQRQLGMTWSPLGVIRTPTPLASTRAWRSER